MSVGNSASEHCHPGVTYFHRRLPPGLYARTNQPWPSHVPRTTPSRYTVPSPLTATPRPFALACGDGTHVRAHRSRPLAEYLRSDAAAVIELRSIPATSSEPSGPRTTSVNARPPF